MSTRPATDQEIAFFKHNLFIPYNCYKLEAENEQPGAFILHPAPTYEIQQIYDAIKDNVAHLGTLEYNGEYIRICTQATQPANPYGMPANPYGMPANPYGMPANPYGMPANPYGMPANPYGMPANPYGMPNNPYGMPANPYGMAANPYAAQPQTASTSIVDQIQALQARIDAQLVRTGSASPVQVTDEHKQFLQKKRILAEKLSKLISCGYTSCTVVGLDNAPSFYGYLPKDELVRYSKERQSPNYYCGGKAAFDYFVFVRNNAALLFGERIRYVLGGGDNYVNMGGESKYAENVSEYACGYDHFVWIDRYTGIVRATGKGEHGELSASGWINCTRVACGVHHTVALKNDGTVLATGDNSSGQCNVSTWKNIVAIACGNHHTVGLRDDGTVVATGSNNFGKCDVGDWRDIIAIDASADNTVGLKADGTLVICGNSDYGQCEIGDLRNVVAVAAGGKHTVAITADGRLHKRGSTSLWDESKPIYLFSNPERRNEEAKNNIIAQDRAQRETWARYAEERRQKEAAEKEKERIDQMRRANGVCLHCGGTFKGLLVRTCTKCGEIKDY